MQIIPLRDIQPILEDKRAVIEAVKEGFIAHSHGRITSPTPMQMIFTEEGGPLTGDCHLKSAYSGALPYFCIKVATGFYDNPKRGIPVNNGLVMLLSSETGEPLAMFQDEGCLTAVRTAAAGALAASLAESGSQKRLGILGAGNQARLQAKWITAHMGVSRITLWGRSIAKTQQLAAKLQTLSVPVRIAATPHDLALQADVIVTTTPALSPIIEEQDIRPGHHIVAVGADSPGKVELDPGILKRANAIYTDDHRQCLAHGEFGHAVRQGYIEETMDQDFGRVLERGPGGSITEQSVSIVDLTGLGAQDLALASLVYERIGASQGLRAGE